MRQCQKKNTGSTLEVKKKDKECQKLNNTFKKVSSSMYKYSYAILENISTSILPKIYNAITLFK